MSFLHDMKTKLFGMNVAGSGSYNKGERVSYTPRTMMGKRITIKLVDFLQELSDFSILTDEEIEENLFVWDPVVGGALDKLSTLVAQCYKKPILNDLDKTDSELEKKMMVDAEKQAKAMRMRDLFELYGELLPLFGDVFIDIRDPTTGKILPNRYITLVERMDQIGFNEAGWLLTDENILVFNETFVSAFTLQKNEFVHLKYKDTPIFAKDRRGRQTFGYYSISPVQRAIIPVWQKRQANIIDILYRWRIIPREVHSIDSTIFSLDAGSGDQFSRLSDVQTEANKYIAAYNKAIENQAPDQGYTVLDTIDIKMLESKTNAYMKTNELVDQLDDQVWTALNMPKSVVSGQGAGSYAGELVVSNFVSQKAMQIAEKIKPLLLANLKARLKQINNAYPVDQLDLKLELNMAAAELETYREAAIMGALNSSEDVFTPDEIRAKLGYQPLTDKQKKEIKDARESAREGAMMGSKSLGDVQRDAINMNPGGQHPNTPESDNKHADNTGKKEVPK